MCLQACYLKDMNVEDSQEVFPYNWAEANAQLYPGRMFTPTTVPGAALDSSPPDLKVLCDLCI